MWMYLKGRQYLLVDVFTEVDVGQAVLHQRTRLVHVGHEQELRNAYRAIKDIE